MGEPLMLSIRYAPGWWDAHASAVSIKWDSTERKPLVPTLGYTRTLYHEGSGVWVTRAGRYLIEGRWSMTAQWPPSLPGSPA